jgi:hypothetical protein
MHRPDGDEATPPLMFFGVAAQHLAMSTQVICPNECQQNHNKKQNNNARSINTHFPSPRRNHDTSTHVGISKKHDVVRHEFRKLEQCHQFSH